MTGRGQVGVADREADNVNPLARDLLLEAVKLGKKVGRQKTQSGRSLDLHLVEVA